MSDEFLTRFRERPSPRFAEELYERINRPRGLRAMRRWGWAPLTLLLALLVPFLISPTIRAGALSVIRRIGGVEVEETDIYPGIEGEHVYRAEVEVYTLAEAREVVPFQLRLPAWTPSGYAIQKDVAVIHASDRRPVTTVMLSWEHPPTSAVLRLEIDHRRRGESPRVVTGHESAETVFVHGAPAALIRGAWHVEEQSYDVGGVMGLLWERDGLNYTLKSWDEALGPEDLVRIAESIP